jgi:hypothetical protein
MYSGLLEKIAISAGIGIIAGAIDAAGFYYTAKIFFANATNKKRILAGFLEIFRLIILIALIIFLCSRGNISFIPLAFTALLLSLGGKMVFIFKGLKR